MPGTISSPTAAPPRVTSFGLLSDQMRSRWKLPTTPSNDTMTSGRSIICMRRENSIRFTLRYTLLVDGSRWIPLPPHLPKPFRQAERLSPVKLDLDFDKAFPSERVGAYERLLLDALAGRLNLFVRSDEQEQAWRWVMPVLETWAADPTPPRPYAAGSWGPAAASALVARDGCTWAEEQ